MEELTIATSKLNIYRYNALNGADAPMTAMQHVPPIDTCYSMDKVRLFIELNNLPFEIIPISEERIIIRSTEGYLPEDDLSEDTERAFYKAIFETTGLDRRVDRWGSKALCWCGHEMQEINTSFDKNLIKANYEKYKMDCQGAKEWCDDWIKPVIPIIVKSAAKCKN